MISSIDLKTHIVALWPSGESSSKKLATSILGLSVDCKASSEVQKIRKV